MILQNRKFDYFKAYLALFVLYIVWGTTFSAIHIGIQSIPPDVLACLRYLSVGLLLILPCLIFRPTDRRLSRSTIQRNFIIGFFLLLTGNALSFWALQYMPTGMAATISSTSPFWMSWLTTVMPPHEKISRISIIGMLVGFFGILVLLSPQLLAPFSVSIHFWLSTIALIFLGFSWSYGSIYARKTPSHLSLFMSIGLQNLSAGLLLLPLCFFTGHVFDFSFTVSSFGALLYLIFAGSILAVPCYMFVLDRLPVPIASSFSYVTPVVTLFVGTLFLKEPLLPTTVLGAGIIFIGLMLTQMGYIPKLFAFRASTNRPA